jgi:myo-inositol-1-phosphate synthase
MGKIKIGIVGVGNCASALAQGLHHYRRSGPEDSIGLMHWDLGGYTPGDIEVVTAIDVDRRKVGRDFHEAIFAPPNCARVFARDLPLTGTKVRMGRILDWVSDHMLQQEEAFPFVPSAEPEADQETVVTTLRESGAEILCNYLPVGSDKASRFYAECALEAGCGFINNIPTWIASSSDYAGRFAARGLPLIGDDIMSQVGATITHRALVELFHSRGLILDRTYQLNTGGNTDFLNMKDSSRLTSKRISKTEAVQAVAGRRLDDRDIHVGPSDYVPWQKDNKVCYLRMEGRGFGDFPLSLELRLSVDDSPNSAGVVIDSIRCARLALDRDQGGVLHGPSSYFCKHPPRPLPNDQARLATEDFILGPG